MCHKLSDTIEIYQADELDSGEKVNNKRKASFTCVEFKSYKTKLVVIIQCEYKIKYK